jgi:hypothetical protein
MMSIGLDVDEMRRRSFHALHASDLPARPDEGMPQSDARRARTEAGQRTWQNKKGEAVFSTAPPAARKSHARPFVM